MLNLTNAAEKGSAILNRKLKQMLWTAGKQYAMHLLSEKFRNVRRERERKQRRTRAAVAGCAVLGCAAAVPLMLLSPGRAGAEKRAPFLGRNFAHRGLHRPDRSVPENSLAAFRLAAEAGYGIELDVRLSADGDVVVFHDDSLKRVCGVDRRVDELTGAELRQLRLYGTEETVPLFSQVLETVGGRVPLIVELKNGPRNRELCRKTCALLRSYQGCVCIESFNPFVVGWFRFHAPEFVRGQLAMPKAYYVREGMRPFRSALLAGTWLNAVGRPNFIAYSLGKRPLSVRVAETLGAMRFGWTAHDPSAEKGRDAVIFEFYRPAIRFK